MASGYVPLFCSSVINFVQIKAAWVKFIGGLTLGLHTKVPTNMIPLRDGVYYIQWHNLDNANLYFSNNPHPLGKAL